MRNAVITSLLVIGVPFGVRAVAADSGAIDLRTLAQKEIRVVTPDGNVALERVPAGKVIPGDEVIYRIEARNIGDRPVESVVITDPIPDNTIYQPETATAEGGLVTFSIDGGKTYDLPDRLRVKDPDGTTRVARESEYTNIRFEFTGALEPGKARVVEFRTRLR